MDSILALFVLDKIINQRLQRGLVHRMETKGLGTRFHTEWKRNTILLHGLQIIIQNKLYIPYVGLRNEKVINSNMTKISLIVILVFIALFAVLQEPISWVEGYCLENRPGSESRTRSWLVHFELYNNYKSLIIYPATAINLLILVELIGF